MHITDNDRLADEIAELAANLDAATHRFLTLIGRFDDAGGWADHGALTCAHWLSWRVGLDLGAAREHVRVARALPGLPQIDDALRRGQISYSKVRALTRVASAEAALLGMARASTASQLERICRGYRLALRNATGERPEDEIETRWVRERETATGLVRFEVQLRPEEAAAVRRALEVARERHWTSRDVPAGTRHASLQRADALVAVAEHYLSGTSDDASESGPPVEVVVHVEADHMAGPAASVAPRSIVGGTLDDGTALPRATTDRILCDAAVVEVVEDSRGNVLDMGRRRRTIPTLLRRALRLRDGGCRFPGCTNRRVDGHHLVPWSRGGATALDNLCSLCRRHHGYVHEFGFRLEPDATRGFRWFRPDGSEIAVSGAPPEIGSDPIATLRAEHHTRGLVIEAATNVIGWDGRPADYGLAVWSLMPSGGPLEDRDQAEPC
jgi:Domain of unknown function (DUF222)/HNH endonuclease